MCSAFDAFIFIDHDKYAPSPRLKKTETNVRSISSPVSDSSMFDNHELAYEIKVIAAEHTGNTINTTHQKIMLTVDPKRTSDSSHRARFSFHGADQSGHNLARFSFRHRVCRAFNKMGGVGDGYL